MLLGASKACNLLAPLYIGVAVDAMALAAPFDAPLGAIAAFAALRFLSKAFKELQNFVYLDVKQTAYREVAARTFRHLHQLSLNWHLSKKTGRALRSMDRGIRSANTVVTYLFLSLGPTVVEWIVTCVIFLTKFGAPLVALVGFVSFIVYVILTFSLTKWRKKIRARMNEQDNDAQDKAVDSLTNFETVKYFTAEVRAARSRVRVVCVCVLYVRVCLARACAWAPLTRVVLRAQEWELRRYTDSIKAYGKHVVHTYASLHLLNTSQQFVIWVSTLIVLILVGNSVAAGEASVGDFIALQVYMVQVRRRGPPLALCVVCCMLCVCVVEASVDSSCWSCRAAAVLAAVVPGLHLRRRGGRLRGHAAPQRAAGAPARHPGRAGRARPAHDARQGPRRRVPRREFR